MQVLHVGRRNGYFYYVTELADNANAPEPATGATAGRSSRDPANTGQETEVKTLPAPEPFPVASYVPRTLREDLDRRKRIPVKECVGIGMAIVAALRHLHEKGLVHRDVKPSNVIFVHGVPKLADVGLVAAAGDSQSIVGTEGYLPPEGPGNPQADLYALGKLLYEISTGMDCGRFPRLPPNLDQLPDATELLEFNEILLKACTKETARRYCRAEELLADLALLERGDSVKRLRRLERHHALYKRVGAGVLAVGILASAAWWQTWRTNRITGRHLAQWHVNEGTRHLGEGNYTAALPFFAGALELDAADRSREMLHRARIAQVLQRCPVPVACFSAPKTKILAADLNPASTVLATAHDDGFVRLWDTRSEKLLQQLRHGFPVVLCQFLTNGTHLLTLTLGQLHVWDLLKPDAPRFSFDQAVEMNSDLYSVGMNARLATVYLSKSRYCFAKIHELNHALGGRDKSGG
jgi:serine/threonine protein kinase